MIKEFNIRYEVSKVEMERMIKNRFEYYKYRIRILKKLDTDRRYKFNDAHMRLGMDTKEVDPVVVSPYSELRDIILGQYDIVKNKYNYVRVLDEICAKQGKLSDDGDAWVDEH